MLKRGGVVVSRLTTTPHRGLAVQLAVQLRRLTRGRVIDPRNPVEERGKNGSQGTKTRV